MLFAMYHGDSETLQLPSYADVQAASERIAPLVHRTPVFHSRGLDERCGARVLLKCENLQRVGAFKFRGASNAVRLLSDEEAQRGVVTHSSGNHAQALALAARMRGIPAYIVMPRTAPDVKREAVLAYGGQVTLCEPTLAAREETCAQIQAQHGATLVHPYDDARIIAGQGTAALELLGEHPELDAILAPVGGGGLLSGTALVAREHGKRVFGVEPAGADDAYRSLAGGVLVPSVEPKTVADGLLTSLGTRNFAILRRDCDGIVTVEEDEILEALEFVWQRVKLVIEPSAAVPVAALMQRKLELQGQSVGVILSGGNVPLAWQAR
jgi:threonine dehydratase